MPGCIAKDSYTPLRMAVTASYVVLSVNAGAPLVGYWSRTGTSAPVLATEGTPQPTEAVAANDFQVYFGDGNHVDTDNLNATHGGPPPLDFPSYPKSFFRALWVRACLEGREPIGHPPRKPSGRRERLEHRLQRPGSE